MFKDTNAFSGYSIDDTEKARYFYDDLLGMDVTDLVGMEEFGMLELHIKNGHTILLYPKDNHQPATFTVLSFLVDDIDKSVGELVAKGIAMLQYDSLDIPQDEKGIARGLEMGQGPDIAWFADPAGNNLAVLQEAR